MHVRPQDAAGDPGAGVDQVMVVVPIDGDVGEAEDVADELRRLLNERPKIGGTRGLQLRTMIVMMMAITPSLKALSRSGRIWIRPVSSHAGPGYAAGGDG